MPGQGALLRDELRAGRTTLRSLPSTINIELTGRCNVRPGCVFCVAKNAPGYREPPHLGEEQLERYWHYLLGAGRVNDCSFGEPLLHPGFERIAGRIADAGVWFGFTTNGLLLDERRCQFLAEHAHRLTFVVSVNAARPETYAWLHGASLERLLDNVARAVRCARGVFPDQPPPLALSFIVMRSNEEEVFEFLELARSLGVRDVMLRHLFDLHGVATSQERQGRAFVYENERLTLQEYQRLEAAIRAAPRPEGLRVQVTWNARESFLAEQADGGVDLPCCFPWKFLSLRPIHDQVSPCAFLKTSVARLSQVSIEEVWNGVVLVNMRESLLQGQIPEICRRFGVCPLVLAG